MSALIPDELRVPDVLGELVGWRAWQIIGDIDFCRLESVTQSTTRSGARAVWPTNRWFEAECLSNPRHNERDEWTPAEVSAWDRIPVEACTCGIYAAKSLAQLARLSYASYGQIADKVVGEVAFAGKVIEGSQGWRAEKARTKRLWVPHRNWRFVEPLAEAYGVEVGFARLLGEQIVLDDEEGGETHGDR